MQKVMFDKLKKFFLCTILRDCDTVGAKSKKTHKNQYGKTAHDYYKVCLRCNKVWSESWCGLHEVSYRCLGRFNEFWIKNNLILNR